MPADTKTADPVIKLQRTSRYPERILQIGSGNFLRGFIGWIVDILNQRGLDAGIVVARPTPSEPDRHWAEQDYLYTTLMRGYDADNILREEKRVITSVTRVLSTYHDFAAFLDVAKNPELRFVFSNTTEAGIVFDDRDCYNDLPHGTFPAKMTRFLHERFRVFGGAAAPGLIFLPCELIADNGEMLRACILKYARLWRLESGFTEWLKNANTFCSTLVDRIVTGFPEPESAALWQELGYEDRAIVVGEYYHLFMIQGPEFVARELNLDGSDLNIHITRNLEPYRRRKVAILNGCHTALAPVALLGGFETVQEAIAEPRLAAYLTRMLRQEIMPFLNQPADALSEYADEVMRRFRNPLIQHRLSAISLNAMAKFKTRLLPQLLQFHNHHKTVPPCLALALAALIYLYRGNRMGTRFALRDEPRFIELFAELWASVKNRPLTSARAEWIVAQVLSLKAHWGLDLTCVDGLPEKVAANIVHIESQGMIKTLEAYLK